MADNTPEEFSFQAEINQLLSLIINAFYSNRDVALRELISNASDSMDKARITSLQAGKVVSEDNMAVHLIANKEAGTLTIRDDGIGMTRQELIDNLGTIARSGTKAFMEALASKQADSSLVGQFGVGFYSAYLIADRVTVISKSEGDDAYKWESNAGGTFTVAPVDATTEHGTSIILHLKEDASEFLEETKVREVVTKHSSFIGFPIYLEVNREIEVDATEEVEAQEAEPDEAKDSDVLVEDADIAKDEGSKTIPKIKKHIKEWDHINKQKPIWLRTPEEVTAEEHNAFYKTISSDWQDPISHKHFKTEGSVEFRGLLYAPRRAPFDMFNAADGKRRNLKLYVRRVFITDDCNELVPEWLSFIKGIVDSDDLPLNVSREMLQQSRMMKIIQKNVVKKAIEMFIDLAEDRPDDFKAFYDAFAKNIKLGVYDGHDSYKEKLVSLLRFHSTNDPDSLTSLLDYTTRAKEDQKRIYYITGESVAAVKTSPFLDKLKAKGYEVLFLTEAIDEYMMQRLKEYKPIGADSEVEPFTFTCITKEGALFDEVEDNDEAKVAKEAHVKSYEPLCAKMMEILKDKVEKVVVSDRLADAPGALVTGTYGWSANMERIMKAQALQNSETFFHMKSKKTLEINPDHKLIKAFKKMEAEKTERDVKAFQNICDGFYDATLLQSGFALDDPAKFVGRFFKLMEAGLSLDEEDAEVEDAEIEAVVKGEEGYAEERTMETLD